MFICAFRAAHNTNRGREMSTSWLNKISHFIDRLDLWPGWLTGDVISARGTILGKDLEEFSSVNNSKNSKIPPAYFAMCFPAMYQNNSEWR